MAEPLKYTNEGVPKNWNGKDWHQYKWAMGLVFRKKKLTEIVEGTIARSDLTSAEKELEFDDNQVTIMQLIGMSLPADKLHQVRDNTTGTAMWKALCEIYECTENKTTMAHRTRCLRTELENMKLSPGGDVNVHLSRMFNLRTELTSLQYTVEDIDMVEIMLDSLPSQYEFESLKSGIRYNSGAGSTSPERARELIRIADSRQKAYKLKGGGNHRGGSKNGGNGGASKDKETNQQHGKVVDLKKKQKKCYICGSKDHLRNDCPDKTKPASGAGANDTEQKRKPRGNLTIHQPPLPLDPNDETRGVVAGEMDRIMIDAGVEAQITSDDEQSQEGEADPETRSLDIIPFADHENTGSGWWYFDTAANAHVTGNRAYYVAFTADSSLTQSVHGVTPALASRIAGVGTVALATEVNGERLVVYLQDVFYVPGAECGLLSPGLAAEQGFDFEYDRQTRNFLVKVEGRTVIVATHNEATWGFHVTDPTEVYVTVSTQNQPLANVTAVEGVASLKLWHERLGHICPQYLKTMADKDMVKGMMLTQRQKEDTCDACHIGKQKKKRLRKKLDRRLKTPNQVVYADLLIPSQGNGTRFEAVLVIMDGYSRFVKVHMLTGKHSEVVNKHMKEYVLWAERQAGRNSDSGIKAKVQKVITRIHRVQQVLTDKGGEFVNDAMDEWYRAQGIEHVLVGPKSSQLNLCERTHQSLVEMTKATMHEAGYPKSLWPEALKNAVYIKNRVYNKGTQGIPFEMMFGVRPDVHHIRKFGALAYVHVPITPGRRKHHDNAKIGFVLGYAEDVIGCKVYFPQERTAKFVPDLRVAEDVMYRDRHSVELADTDLESLHFERDEEVSEPGMKQSTSGSTSLVDYEQLSGSEVETVDFQSRCLEGGEKNVAAGTRESVVGVRPMASVVDMTMMSVASVGDLTEVDGVTVPILSGADVYSTLQQEANRSQNMGSEANGMNPFAMVGSQEEDDERQSGGDTSSKASQVDESIHDDERESVVAMSGSVTASEGSEAGNDYEEENEK